MLSSPASYKLATPEQIAEICNGCGAANAKFDFVPDTIYGLDISEACKIHDWRYHFGRTDEDKQEADRELLNNLLRIINKHGGLLRGLRRRRAKTYYLAVKYYGGPAFWENK